MNHSIFHLRARQKGVSRSMFWFIRLGFEPFALAYFRLSRKGHKNIPATGPLIFAANHRSFLDPFIIAVCLRRPIYYVAKRELFERRFWGWVLNHLGAFPVDRGAADAEMIKTAKAILARGDAIVIFPEGTRIRKPTLGKAKRGVGRLALETGAPVIPVGIRGTGNVRRGLLIKPRKVRIRFGPILHFPHVQMASQGLATSVTDRIWLCVTELWQSVGGKIANEDKAPTDAQSTAVKDHDSDDQIIETKPKSIEELINNSKFDVEHPDKTASPRADSNILNSPKRRAESELERPKSELKPESERRPERERSWSELDRRQEHDLKQPEPETESHIFVLSEDEESIVLIHDGAQR